MAQLLRRFLRQPIPVWPSRFLTACFLLWSILAANALVNWLAKLLFIHFPPAK